MALDAYSLCPGGTGKKIKFCCNDFLPELQKIDRMVEGEQFIACLKHIDHLLEQEPGEDRACLLATKCTLLRMTKQDEAARVTAAAFVEKHPENQLALAESALSVVGSDACAALDFVGRAFRAAAGSLSGQTYQAMGLTAGALLHANFPLPARALLQLQCDLTKQDERPQELLSSLSQAIDIPLLLRDDATIVPCPDDATWKDQFSEALQAVAMGDWQTGAARFAALAAEKPNEPVVWRNLATLCGWVADNAGCIEALHKYATLRAAETDGLDDAVEAEAEAMFLSEDPLGDRREVYKVVCPINDVDRACEAFLSSPRFHVVPFDPAQFSDGQTPPPKAAYMLLDRPMPDGAEGLSQETMPLLMGQALLFGKQTDREAQIDVMGVVGDDLQAVKDLIAASAGDAVRPSTEEVVGHVSASQKLLRTQWMPPRDATPEQLQPLMEQHGRNAIINRWADLKLGFLDGRSPREAAGEENNRIGLLAAIHVLEYWSERMPGKIDFNELRAELGLPVQDPIDPGKHPVVELPVIRLGRLIVEELSDQDLLIAFYRAGAFAMRPVLRKFAEAIVQRPSMADSDIQLHAYSTLARNEENLDRALEYIDQGRQVTAAKNGSCASWDLMELSLRFTAHDGQEAMRLIQHIQDKHIEEPGVGESLTRMLVDVGLLRPDGTPAFGPEGPAPAMPTEAPAAESGGLWTPDGAEPGDSGGGKLWTPE